MFSGKGTFANYFTNHVKKKARKQLNEQFPKINHYFHPNVGLNSLAMLIFYLDYYLF